MYKYVYFKHSDERTITYVARNFIPTNLTGYTFFFFQGRNRLMIGISQFCQASLKTMKLKKQKEEKPIMFVHETRLQGRAARFLWVQHTKTGNIY
jgi:hypothetical protein